MLIVEAAAPPPKNLVTTNVAKFCANAEGNREITRIEYPKKYPGLRPHDSDNGTNIGGRNAAPNWKVIVANWRFGKGSFWTWNLSAMYSFPLLYEPAGKETITFLFIESLILSIEKIWIVRY